MQRFRSPRLLTALAGAALLIAGAVSASAETASAETDATLGRLPAFPLERLEPGLEGYGLTAGPSERIESFTARVLAVQESFGPGAITLVLIETGGSLIDAAGGVAAGMSGSPVYLELDGETALLGAIGYVFPDSDGNLALVTPIESMRAQARESGAAPHLPSGALAVSTPVLVSGLGERAMALLESEVLSLATLQLDPLRSGSAGAGTGSTAAPEAGSAIAVALVRGDLDVAAIGTVTEVAGNELLALGHPFLGSGPASWGLAPATVTAIVPSRRVPFKLANVSPESLGAVVSDGPAGVVGRLDVEPDLVPVTLTVDAAGRREVLHFEVAAHEQLWPVLSAVATLEGIDRVWRRVSEGSAKLAWEIELEGGPPLRLLEEVSSPADVALHAALMAGAPLALLARNPFEAARPLAVQLVVEVDERRRDGELVEVLLESDEVIAGESLALLLRLQPWRRQGEVHALTVALPSELDEVTELVVRGAAEPRDDEHEGGVDELILSYGELLTVLRERSRSGDLVIEVRRPDGRWELLERRTLPYIVRGVKWLTLEPREAEHDLD